MKLRFKNIPVCSSRACAFSITEMDDLIFCIISQLQVIVCYWISFSECQNTVLVNEIPGFEGKISSPYYPSYYPPKCKCTWKFQVAEFYPNFGKILFSYVWNYFIVNFHYPYLLNYKNNTI